MRNLSLWLEAARWRRVGRTARLWWRDDDAAGYCAQFERLLRLSSETRVPLTLAVVPAGDMAGLGARLTERPTGASSITVAQHGVDHLNRRSGPAAGEFPHDWTQAELEIALRRGWSLTQRLPHAEPVFVPPWNDVHPQLEAALAACGYAGWSVNGELAPGEGLARVDVHLDLLRWRGGARFRGRARFLRALTAELARRRKAGLWDAPIGLLTHHLAHDAASWRFLEAFLRWTQARRELSWVALPQMIGEAGERRRSGAQTPLSR